MKEPLLNRMANRNEFGLFTTAVILTVLLTMMPFAEALQETDEPTQPTINVSWGLEAIEAPRAQTMPHAQATIERQNDVIIAVIDTGADTRHHSLRDAIWKNPGETGRVESAECRHSSLARCDKARNGIDDDGNGFVDDVNGWNFVGNNPDVFDNHGHGTHVAGIIGSSDTGVAPRAKLMILKYIEPRGSQSKAQNPIQATANAIRYAVKMGASIINYSAGGPSPSEIERQAVLEALRAGVLIIAASGNDGRNTDRIGYFPADYDVANVLPVASVDPSGKILESSNYGLRRMRIAAPGENISSAIPGNKQSLMTGTSQATAFVSGVSALLMMSEPSLKRRPQDMIRRLVLSGNISAKLERKTRDQTTLNAFRALSMRDEPRDSLPAQLHRLQNFAQSLREKSARAPTSQKAPQSTLRPPSPMPEHMH